LGSIVRLPFTKPAGASG